MTYYDLDMNSKKLTETAGVERDTAVSTTNIQQVYKASNSSPANCSTELRIAGGAQNSTGNVELFVAPDPTQSLAGYYSYSATSPGLFFKSILPDGASGSTEYSVLTDNYNPSLNEKPENRITMRNSSSYSQNNITLRVSFDVLGQESNLVLGWDSYTLSINNGLVSNINNTSNDMNQYRNIKFGTDTAANQVGVKARTSINATTTGTTTLTTANAFTYHINTPSAAGRIFVLPAPSANLNGTWWAVINKSAAQTITIQSSAGVALATIPITTAGGAGNVAKIAIDNAGTGYCRIG